MALVGVVAGFYLNGLREKERPVREQRLKALDDMRAQCHVIVVAYENWRGKVENLQPMVIPPSGPIPDPASSILAKLATAPTSVSVLLRTLAEGRVQPYRSTIHAKRNEVVALTKEGHDSLQEMKVLEGMYQAYKPYLETKTRDIFDSFHKEFTNQHALISNKLENLATMLRSEPLEQASVSNVPIEKTEKAEQSLIERIVASAAEIQPRQWLFGDSDQFRNWQRRLARVDELMANLTNAVNDEIRETVQLARTWGSGAHLRAFETEAERVAGTRS